MDDSTDYIELVKQAQLGNRDSLNSLAELVRGRLYAYVYRIILLDDTAQDIVQETMIEMFKVLGKLQRADRFWPWLRSIAFNKIRRYYGARQRHRTVSMSQLGDANLPQAAPEENEAGLSELLGKELRQIIFDAMGHLKPRYRTVLVMRCYEEMEYSQIAELMQSSELAVRVLFHRAKKSLQKRLSLSGLQKSFLLSALVLFGEMTAPSEAAAAQISITAATVRTGAAAALIAMATSKATIVTVKALAVPLVAVGGYTAGKMVPTTWVDKPAEWVGKTMTVVERKRPAPPAAPVSKARREGWYYYPEHTEAAVMIRMTEYDSRTNRYHRWLQDDQANYYFDGVSNTIHINNYRMYNSDLTVRRLPCDKPQLTEFLSAAEGTTEPTEYVAGTGDGLLVIVKHDENRDLPYSQTTHHQNLLDEEYFRYNWPLGATVVDNRDDMHRRGWTYFRITGQINDRQLSGLGRIPFVYAANKQHPPWLRLYLADDLEIADCIDGAYAYTPGRLLVAYPAGSFLQGLARPWMGLHAIDTIRRDAARRGIRFQTGHSPESGKAEVILSDEQSTLIYTIDLEKDIIDKITFSEADRVTGEMRFSYLQQIGRVGSEFIAPRKKLGKEPSPEDLEMLWLMRLAKDNL